MSVSAPSEVGISRPRIARGHSLHVVAHLVSREFRLRYRRAVLGWLWALLVPLLKFGVMAFVFSKVLAVKVENFPAYLFSGVVFVTLFTSGATSATNSIVQRANLTLRAGLPRWAIPVVSVLTDAIDLAVSIPVLITIAIVTSTGVGPSLLFLPLIVIVLTALTLGVGMLLCTWNVFHRDVRVLVEVVMLLAFYLSPVFYDPKSLPSPYRRIIELNPLAVILKSGRNVTIYNRAPDWGTFIPVSVVSFAILAVGWLVFQSRAGLFGDEL